jgi:hypothetical protein
MMRDDIIEIIYENLNIWSFNIMAVILIDAAFVCYWASGLFNKIKNYSKL